MSRLAIFVAGALLATACTVAPAPSETTTSTSAATTTTTSTAPTTTTSPEQARNARLLEQIDELIGVTEQIRELPFLEHPTVSLVDDGELEARVRRLISEEVDPEELRRDAALETLLGLIPPGTDLLALYQDLYGEQVLGFYDGETKEMVVPAAGDELTPAQKVTLVHELTHALTDQHFGFADLSDRLDQEQRYDELAALQAVTEGDATLTEIHYVTSLPRDQQLEIVNESLDQNTAVFDRAPRFIQDLLVFPYNAGYNLLNALWRDDSRYQPINELYTDPPASTEQVMHLDKFTAREAPIEVVLPDVTLDGYEVAESSTWGELLFQVMLEQVLGSNVATAAATGWGGDSYRLYSDGTRVAFVLLYQGDSPEDAAELADALEAYAPAAMAVTEQTADGLGTLFTGDVYAFVARSQDQVLFIAADDAGAGALLRDAFPDF